MYYIQQALLPPRNAAAASLGLLCVVNYTCSDLYTDRQTLMVANAITIIIIIIIIIILIGQFVRRRNMSVDIIRALSLHTMLTGCRHTNVGLWTIGFPNI